MAYFRQNKEGGRFQISQVNDDKRVATVAGKHHSRRSGMYDFSSMDGILYSRVVHKSLVIRWHHASMRVCYSMRMKVTPVFRLFKLQTGGC